MCLLKTDRVNNPIALNKQQSNFMTGKRTMTRMDRLQRKILQQEFDRKPIWSQEKVEALAARLCIPKAKVYKWNWDQRNKKREYLQLNQPNLATTERRGEKIIKQ